MNRRRARHWRRNFAIQLPSITGANLNLSIGFPEESAEVSLALAFELITLPLTAVFASGLLLAARRRG